MAVRTLFRFIALLALVSSACYGQIGGRGVGGGPCRVSGSATTGYVVTATSTGTNPTCDWEAVGGASVTQTALKNAWYIADGGVANGITGTTTTAYPGAYAVGQAVIVKMNATNTGATTINVNSIGAVAVTKNGAAALAAGNLVAGRGYLLTYDGTEFQVANFTILAADIPTLNQNTSGNAATATALAANGTNCSANQFAAGVDASGNAEGCAAPLTSVFTGSTATNPAFSATPTFSLADVSVKSAVRIEPGALTANVTSVTFTNKTAGAKFSIAWTQDGTGGRTVAYGASAANTCAVDTTVSATTTQFFEVGADGTTVNGTGCISTVADTTGPEIAKPGTPPAITGVCWWDSTNHVRSCMENNSSTVSNTVVPDTGAANNYVSAISPGGIISKSRPTCATLSDSVSTCNSLVSPAFTGTPTAPTAAATDNSTLLATTAYVTTGIANAVNAAAGRDLVQAATAAVLPNTPTFTHVDSGVGSFLTSSTNSVLVIDGYTPLLLDRILVKNQATAANNGIYYVSQLGVATVTPWILLRALDYDQANDINNTIVPVANHGTANALSSWIQTATVATVDTDAINFAAFTPNGANLVSAVSPGAGLGRYAGGTQTQTSAELSGDCTTSGSNAVTCKPGTTVPGTSVTLAGSSQIFICTSTCTITVPVPSLNVQYCVMNDDNVATVITMSAIGSSARYENTARTAYGTAGTGTFVSGGAVGDFVCLVGRDSTHYLTASSKGTWIAN